MINHPERGTDRGSMITGRSVHNQRQERLWRDVNHGCTHVFYSLFHYMEEQYILDPTCEEHLFCLHYVFAPRINQNLEMFKNGWNNHGLTTEVNRTPSQLWIRGMLNQQLPNCQWEPSTQVNYLLYFYHLKKLNFSKMHASFFRKNLSHMELTGMDHCHRSYGEVQCLKVKS